MVFLERLSDIGGASLPSAHISLLGSLYHLDSTPNVEIRLRFYNLVLASSSASEYLQGAAKWLVEGPNGVKGRMKFCRPVFKALGQVDSDFAKNTFRSNAQFFHPIARKLIEKVICCCMRTRILMPCSIDLPFYRILESPVDPNEFKIVLLF